MKKAHVLWGWLLSSACLWAATNELHFDGPMSRAVLERYLSRAITMMDYCTGQGDPEDNLRMLKNIGARFAGRTLYMWGRENQFSNRVQRAREIAARTHQVMPEIILQGCVFEIVTPQVATVPIPPEVFQAFGLPVETRNFRYEAMLFDQGVFLNHWGKNTTVPDMTKLETRLWFYHVATTYISAGMEAIHFGQVALIGRHDKNWDGWWDMLSRVRQYAARHARRHWVLCDAHTPDGGPRRGEQLLFDFHSFPLRIKEVVEQPQKGILEKGYLDSIYGRSRGGLTPAGWRCESLPYLVELDNWGGSSKPGTPGMRGWTWGYDEISWFAHQPEDYQKEWLRYAWKWVRETDSNGWLQMPGSRVLHTPLDTPQGKRYWYYANMQRHFPQGFNHEDTIKEIWSQ
ncbi:hypothetical protein NXS98_12390 [Fontisphaera persica]|uniref:hypothetical protein n=1 Tax=Fontisphaera persica TaxID=2974023 RepID=UPI0024BFCE0E|nr:hypothetical protein [Fontisphaera persica]WCJ58515.1 hypothetical protein NXS98_12390 [Fontisphaera persica]